MGDLDFEGVEGYLSGDDRRLLRAMAAARGPGRVVECGSWKGLSALCLLSGMAPEDRLVCCDLFDHLGEHEVNLARHGFADRCDRYACDFDALPDRMRGFRDPVSLLFLDGSHRFGEDEHLLGYFERHLCSGATVVLHDARDDRFPAVGGLLPCLGARYVPIGGSDCSAAYRWARFPRK